MEEVPRQAQVFHALNIMPSFGPVKFQRLSRVLGNAQSIWNASVQELGGVEGIGRAEAELFAAERQKIDLEKSWEGVQKSGCKVVTIEDPSYPPQLLQIYDPPLLLYCFGELEILHTCCFSIVGSRRHTGYGKELALKFAEELSSRGQLIVSGMARGIDTWVHRGTLKSGGATAAVLGCGVDVCYPPENKDLKADIERGGAVVSEFPPGFQPLPQNFPRRNRIISGFSWGTLVIEAGERSGALITAEFALDQGREVFAVPGSVASPYSRGCHRLIKEGAKLVEHADDILEELPPYLRENGGILEGVQMSLLGEAGSGKMPELNAEEKQLLEHIGYQPSLLEEIIRLSELSSSRANALLFDLEMKGFVRQLPGKYFVKTQ